MVKEKKIHYKVSAYQRKLRYLSFWRIRNPKCQNITFRQNHSTRFIERRLDYISVSNFLLEFVNCTDALPAISTDCSPVLISLSNDNSDNNGRGLWKYNNSLVYDEF